MACVNCETLRERVHELERELGVRMVQGAVLRLVVEMKIRPMAARAVMILFQAKGRFVPMEVLTEQTGFSTNKNLRLAIWFLRKQAGEGAIISAWGKGYTLGEDFRRRVAEVLA